MMMLVIKKSVLNSIRWYQRMGGSRSFFGIECNFPPTCSEYTHQAITKYGLCKGIKLGLQRIKRCSDPDCTNIEQDPLR